MVSEFGIFFLLLTLIISSFSFISPLTPNNKGFIINLIPQKKISFLVFFFTLLSFCCLTYSFIVSDFSLNVVAKNSNSQLPLVYRITGVWGNHEGSILLWLLVMTFFGFLFSISKISDHNLKKKTLTIQNSLIFLVCAFVIFTSNPFDRSFPPSIEGSDLNPLLQDPGLVIHPPMLYLGYVGFSIVYSISLAVLMLKKKTNFIKILKPWVFISWTFLTAGIGLGSWWAYYELGWGGFWFWDPVENASLLPWLTASALIHTVIISGKNNILINWTLLLSIITFLLSLLGTFLVRSGVLVSVHAFANDPTRGIFILIMLLAISTVGLFYFLKRTELYSSNHQINLISREGAISLNNIFLISLTFTILIGTIYPLISSIFFKNKLSVGAPFFNSILAPVMIPMILGMIIGPFLRWGKDDLLKLLIRLKLLVLLFFVSSIFLWYLNFGGPVLALIFFIFATWVIISSIFELFKFINFRPKFKINPIPAKLFSQSISHIGIGLIIIGATGSSILKIERIQFQEIDEIIKINQFDVKFKGVKIVEGPNYISQKGDFEVFRENSFVTKLEPEKRYYNAGKQVTTEAAIHSTILGDLYIAIGDKNFTKDSESWTTRVWFNPFTIWIWSGVFLLVLGGLTSFFRVIKHKK